MTHYRLSQVPAEIRFPYDPFAVVLGEGAVWVLTQSIHQRRALLRIDPRTGSVSATRLPGAQPEQLGGGSITQFAVGEGAAWVPEGNTLFRIDPATGRVTGKATLHGSAAAGDLTAVVTGDGAVWALALEPNRLCASIHGRYA